MRCIRCAVPLVTDTGQCGTCLTRTDPTGIDQCAAAVDYAYPWDALLAQFKFRQQPGWASTMARLMLQTPEAGRLLRHSDAMVPIPLSPPRLATRGYNQAWELVKALRQQATAIGHAVGRPRADALLRIGDTPDQHRLPRAARLHNRQSAFVANPKALPWIMGKHVLLVDDVVTTGATLQAASLVLRSAGARKVSALVFARTPSS
jgi:ComF family protein